jgi:hypothetical protein
MGSASYGSWRRIGFLGPLGFWTCFTRSSGFARVAHCLYAQKSPEAEEFVSHHLRMLLEGKVRYVLRNFHPLVKEHHLKGEKKNTVQSAISYYEKNQEHMRYDEYLAAGYPIASGVAEGACKHLVKDRMERAGMRWELEGAQAMLSLRAVHIRTAE